MLVKGACPLSNILKTSATVWMAKPIAAAQYPCLANFFLVEKRKTK
jgi:hypothetical protein